MSRRAELLLIVGCVGALAACGMPAATFEGPGDAGQDVSAGGAMAGGSAGSGGADAGLETGVGGQADAAVDVQGDAGFDASGGGGADGESDAIGEGGGEAGAEGGVEGGVEAGDDTGTGCLPGWQDCDGDDSNGCEANTNASVQHCGACGVKCPSPFNSSPICSSGECSFQCVGAYSDCNGVAADGCEIDTATDEANCGACGFGCVLAHATALCVTQACTIGQCDTGWGACDGNLANGCETNTLTSTQHCGECDHACSAPANADAICGSGVCGYVCKTGYANCNGLDSDGCEASRESYESTVMADGPIAYWRLGESTGPSAIDATGHGHTGTFVGGTLGVPGAIACDPDRALRLSATDSTRVTVPRSAALEPASAVTVEAWIRQTGSATSFSMIVWYGDNSTEPWGSWGIQRNNMAQTSFSALVATKSKDAWVDFAGIVAGAWQHVALSYDGTLLRTYLNGAESFHDTLSGAIQYDGVHGLVIGAYQVNAGVFNGEIDEVAVYGKPLTAQRILAHYTAGSP